MSHTYDNQILKNDNNQILKKDDNLPLLLNLPIPNYSQLNIAPRSANISDLNNGEIDHLSPEKVQKSKVQRALSKANKSANKVSNIRTFNLLKESRKAVSNDVQEPEKSGVNKLKNAEKQWGNHVKKLISIVEKANKNINRNNRLRLYSKEILENFLESRNFIRSTAQNESIIARQEEEQKKEKNKQKLLNRAKHKSLAEAAAAKGKTLEEERSKKAAEAQKLKLIEEQKRKEEELKRAEELLKLEEEEKEEIRIQERETEISKHSESKESGEYNAEQNSIRFISSLTSKTKSPEQTFLNSLPHQPKNKKQIDKNATDIADKLVEKNEFRKYCPVKDLPNIIKNNKLDSSYSSKDKIEFTYPKLGPKELFKDCSNGYITFTLKKDYLKYRTIFNSIGGPNKFSKIMDPSAKSLINYDNGSYSINNWHNMTDKYKEERSASKEGFNFINKDSYDPRNYFKLIICGTVSLDEVSNVSIPLHDLSINDKLYIDCLEKLYDKGIDIFVINKDKEIKVEVKEDLKEIPKKAKEEHEQQERLKEQLRKEEAYKKQMEYDNKRIFLQNLGEEITFDGTDNIFTKYASKDTIDLWKSSRLDGGTELAILKYDKFEESLNINNISRDQIRILCLYYLLSSGDMNFINSIKNKRDLTESMAASAYQNSDHSAQEELVESQKEISKYLISKNRGKYICISDSYLKAPLGGGIFEALKDKRKAKFEKIKSSLYNFFTGGYGLK